MDTIPEQRKRQSNHSLIDDWFRTCAGQPSLADIGVHLSKHDVLSERSFRKRDSIYQYDDGFIRSNGYRGSY